jgi:perosamine synthetase
MNKIDLFRSKQTGKEGEAIHNVLKSGWWAQGAKVAEFEEKWAKFCGAKYAVATNSATAALDIAVKVAPLGDEVTVSPLTFVSSALAILHNNKKVKFVDIDPYSHCSKKADIQVLYAGNDFGEGIIYDMAHGAGMRHRGIVSCWSFHAVKNLPTGDGGMLTTDDPEIYRRAKALAWCGIDKSTYDRDQDSYSWDYHIEEVGWKANMNDITAAIGLCQLDELQARNSRRFLISRWYDRHLHPDIPRPFPSSTWHMYAIEVDNRDALYDALAAENISAGVHYKPLYKYPIFPQTELPVAEATWKRLISLPMHLDLSEADVERVCDIVNTYA